MRRSHVLAALTAIIALCFALPAVGATSPLKTAKQALGLAKKANTSAASAKKSATAARKSATAARKTATAAQTTARSALEAAGRPVGTAATAVTAQNATNAQNAANAQNATNAQNAVRAASAATADNHVVLPTRTASVTGSGATVAASRAAASPVVLFERGSLTVYAKCHRDTGAGRVYGEVFVRSSVDGATLASDGDDLSGGATSDFLNIATPEDDARVDGNDVVANAADTGYSDDGQFQVMAPNGSFIDGYVNVGVKQGTLAGGNGPFPATDGCLFNGVLSVG